MARRKTKKEKKQQLKEDSFRDTILDAGKAFKEYKYLILLTAAVIVLFAVLFSMRAERKEKDMITAANIIKPNTNAGPEELKKQAAKVSGQPLESWILIRQGSALYKLYQKEGSLAGEKTRLHDAKKVYEDVLKRFGNEGSAVYIAKNAIEQINKELEFEYPEAVKKAYERKINPPKRTPPPKMPPIKQPPAIKKENKPGEIVPKITPPDKPKEENKALKNPKPPVPEKDD